MKPAILQGAVAGEDAWSRLTVYKPARSVLVTDQVQAIRRILKGEKLVQPEEHFSKNIYYKSILTRINIAMSPSRKRSKLYNLLDSFWTQ